MALPKNFTITLNGITYKVRLRWCPPLVTWILYFNDVNDNPILNGVPLVTGANLLAQYGYLGFEGALVVTKDDGDPTPPTWDNLGTIGHLFFLSEVPAS